MIQTKAKSLHQLIEKKRILRSEKEHIEAYKTRRVQLQREIIKVVQLCQRVSLMFKYDICNKAFEEELQPLRSIGIQLLEQFSKKPEWLRTQGALRILTINVDSVAKQIEEELKMHWEDYLEKDLPSINNDMLNIMLEIPSFYGKVNNIKNLYRDINLNKENIPIQENELKSIIEKKYKLINEWNSLGAEDVPLAVLTFIRSAASYQGAVLNNFTPEVYDWLKQYNIQTFFKIHLKK